VNACSSLSCYLSDVVVEMQQFVGSGSLVPLTFVSDVRGSRGKEEAAQRRKIRL